MSRGKTGKIIGQELEKFESVQNWLSSLSQASKSKGKAELTPGAKRQRLGRMLEYTKFTGKNPDELLAEAQKDINKAGTRLDEIFKNRVAKDNPDKIEWNTACTNLGYLRGFYTHNNLTFPKRWKIPTRKVSKVSKTDAKVVIYDYDEESGEAIFNNGILQHFIQNLNFRDQTITLCLLSSGADAEDLLQLNIDFIKDSKGQICKRKRFFWHSNRQKDGIEFKTLFSEEATEFVRRYVEQERTDARGDEPLFVRKFEKTVGFDSDGKKVTETVTERLGASALAFNFKSASEKMGYKTGKESNPFRPKRFRHLFRTACSQAHIDQGFTMAMMGHASNMSASYLEKSDGLYIQEYVKIEPYLIVFGINKERVNELSEEIYKLGSTVDVLTKSGETVLSRTEALEVELAKAREEVKLLNNQMVEMYDFVHSNFDLMLDFFSEISGTKEGQELVASLNRKRLEKERFEVLEAGEVMKEEEGNVAKKLRRTFSFEEGR